MKPHSILLMGGPDSGKTNYLARLWEALRSREGSLKATNLPPNIEYVEDALKYLLQGKFAPRSEKNLDESHRDFMIPVEAEGQQAPVEIVVPDVSGELWKAAVETMELPAKWMDQMRNSSGALLFVRVLSDLNVMPLDWVTAGRLLKLGGGENSDSNAIPTQVSLCELLRFLELSLSRNDDGSRPRVAVTVTAWDRLDAASSKAGPRAYIEKEYPLFAGRLKDTKILDIAIFGVSVVGGDLDLDTAFREQYLEGDLRSAGYVVTEVRGETTKVPDMTLPVTWLVSGG